MCLFTAVETQITRSWRSLYYKIHFIVAEELNNKSINKVIL